MKWIKYQFVCNEEDEILLTKKIGYSEENLAIAQKEAYNGEYTIEEDEETIEKEPLPVNLGGTGVDNYWSLAMRTRSVPGFERIFYTNYDGALTTSDLNVTGFKFSEFETRISIEDMEPRVVHLHVGAVKDQYLGYLPPSYYMHPIGRFDKFAFVTCAEDSVEYMEDGTSIPCIKTKTIRLGVKFEVNNAIKGYDLVLYRDEDWPEEGDREFQTSELGITFNKKGTTYYCYAIGTCKGLYDPDK